ncbi:MAG: hypothetical protein ABJ242_10935 [Marinomonas sp.]
MAADRYLDLLNPIIVLVTFVAYFYAQNRLYQILLRNSGVPVPPGLRTFRLLGMALVIGIALSFASNFFILPALVLGAKWIMAPSVLVANAKSGIFSALGESWTASDGNTLQLTLAFAAVFSFWAILIIAIGSITDATNLAAGYNFFTALTIYILPIFMMGLSVAAFRQLTSGTADIAEVFV